VRARIKLHVLPATPPTHFSIARSTLLVMAATLASSILGAGRDIINGYFYGASASLDAFLVAAVIPTILFGIFNGALVSALVPVFSEYVARGEDVSARRLASTVFNGLLIGLAILATFGWLLAPVYVPIIASGFPAPELAMTTEMTRWLMPTIVFTSLAGVASALLYAHHRFSAAAAQGIAVNIVTIGCVLAFASRLGIYALVLGTAFGLVAQLLVQLPAILRSGMYSPVLDLGHPGLGKIYRMFGPIVVGSAVAQLGIFFERHFASSLSAGYISGMYYATRFVGLPQQIFAQAVATVIFPLFASQFATANSLGVRRSLVMGLRVVNLVTIPSVFGLIALGYPIVAVVLQRGQFGPTATALTAGLLPYAAIALVGTAAGIVLTRCCFAAQQTRWPVAISIFAVLLNVTLCVVWLPTLGARGLLLASGVSQWAQAALLLILVYRLVDGFDLKGVAISALRIIICSAIMVGTLHWIASLGVHVGPSLSARAWYLIGQLAIGAFVFIGAARLFGVEELGIALKMIVQKFERRLPSPPESADAPIA
jgi:putative peptidoglycan lipid II flippase